MKDNNYSAPQVNKDGKKKFLASAMALVLAITGGIGARNAVKSYKGKNVEHTTTSQSTPVTAEPEVEELDYVLVEPFEINDVDSVKATIDAVNQNNKKDDSVKKDLSEKILKFYNGTLTRNDFSSMSDDDIANEVKNFTIELNEVTSASILDYVNLREGEKLTEEEKSTKAIGLSDIFTKDSYAYETYATEYDTILNEQKKDIATGDKEDYSENADDFITLMKTALKDDDLSKAEKAAVATITKTQSVLFWNAMSKEDQNYFLKEDQGKYNTAAVDEWFQEYDIETSIDFNKTNGGDKSKNRYEASDKADAEKHAGSTGEEGTKLVHKGGKRTDSKKDKKVIEEATTKISVVSQEATTNSEDATIPSKTEEGNEVVSTTVQVETTSEINNEIVPPEEEVEEPQESNDYVYSDADFNSLDSKEKGLITLGSGVASLGSMLVYKKKKRRTLEEIEAEEASKSKKHR